ncbi:hypothetical protein ARMSODRAFT_732557 [Armillaria solidipes]|uniref:Uncharacterized protein n=1 Tax=Armillaria solidipes TaxID=1076256 RepID=A0A2H3AN26_9AGAR|nr:hypothetical protein ARMSODRAFT_732557 [Armillaria solidipes]
MLRSRHRCWISTGSYRLLLSYWFASTLSLWTSIGPWNQPSTSGLCVINIQIDILYDESVHNMCNRIFHGYKDDVETGFFFLLPLLSL